MEPWGSKRVWACSWWRLTVLIAYLWISLSSSASDGGWSYAHDHADGVLGVAPGDVGVGRVKRQAVDPMVSISHLNSSHLHVIVHHVGQGSPNMFFLGKDQTVKNGSRSVMYLSTDHGRTFEDISSRFLLEPDQSRAVISSLYPHPKSNCMLVFTDVLNKHIFTTTDCGHTIQSHRLDDINPSLIQFDERRHLVFLIHDLISPKKSLYVTHNFGETFVLVQDYVKLFFLRYNSNDTELFTQRLHPGLSNGEAFLPNVTTILSSKNFFQSETTIVFHMARDFQVLGPFMFVTKPDPARPEHLELLVSIHGGRFVQATFDGMEERNLTARDYHIMDVTEDEEIMVIVNHSPTLSNLYSSARISAFEATFTLSLERVMYYNPNVTWHDSYLAATAGSSPFADVYRIKGLRGAYVANQIRQEAWDRLNSIASTTAGHVHQRRPTLEPSSLESVITFNRGAMWTAIRGPHLDEEGRNLSSCEDLPNGGCRLHLAQAFSGKFPATRSVPVSSSASAVGIVIGTGNVGPSLSHKSNVFMSVDAGLSWRQILKGFHYFKIGDHGGIIVAAKGFHTGSPTNQLLYSTDYAMTWKNLTFYERPLRVFGLIVEPGEKSSIFSVFGTEPASPVSWIMVTVDLSPVFPRNCSQEDYIRWSPQDNSLGKHRNCLLGRKEFFERRQVKSNCLNGRDRERVALVENCECERSDYSCDFGFIRDEDERQSCVVDPRYSHDPFHPPEFCEAGQLYNQTQGYVKIPGDSCQGGKTSMYEPLRLPCPLAEEKEFMLVAIRNKTFRIDLRDPSKADTVSLMGPDLVVALDFDVRRNCLFYSHMKKQIVMQCLNGSAPRVLLSHIGQVDGIAFDWINDLLYFADVDRSTIEVIRTYIDYDGRMRKVLVNSSVLVKPRAIVVHPQSGYLFFTDWNYRTAKIGRAHMDGTNVQTLFNSSVVHWPNGLTIDSLSGRLFWVDKSTLSSSDMDGRNRVVVLSRPNELLHPFSVAVHKQLVYWNDWNNQAIYVVDKSSGKGLSKFKSDLMSAMSIKIYDQYSQPAGSGPCSNQPCSHLCLPTPNGHSCHCPDGLTTVHDAQGLTKCLCPHSTIVAFSNGTCPPTTPSSGTLGAGVVCNPESQFTCADGVMCIPLDWVCNHENDCGDGSDEGNCSLSEQACKPNHFQCADKKCITSSWRCDFDLDCADGSDEVNCNHTVCSTNSFQCANGQCILAQLRCNLQNDCQDGSDERNCQVPSKSCKRDQFECSIGGLCIPRNWVCDGESDCGNGEDERDCSPAICVGSTLPCSNGVCISSTWWCDGDQDCLDGSDEVNCTDSEIEEHRLGYNEDGDQLPLPAFPFGSQCNDWMYRCSNGQCIPYWWLCDHNPDCEDQSDEDRCRLGISTSSLWPSGTRSTTLPNATSHVSSCGPTKFSCLNGSCIWQAWVCDGQSDCDSGEDEMEEMCREFPAPCDPDKQFRCQRSRQCVMYGQICDGVADCTDGSDESGCENDAGDLDDHDDEQSLDCSKPGQFECDLGTQCFPESALCDGHLDCVDGTDEASCDGAFQLPQIVRLSVTENGIQSSQVSIDWMVSDISLGMILEYQFGHALYDGQQWTFTSEWAVVPQMNYTFTNLFPFTRYSLSLKWRIVGQESTEFTYKPPLSLVTAPDVPSAPMVTNVLQQDDDVHITWTAPSKPNGVLTRYHIALFALKPDGSVDQSDVSSYITNSPTQTSFVLSGLRTAAKYNVTVTAENSHYKGQASLPFTFELASKNLERVSMVSVVSSGPNGVDLQWPAVKLSDGSQRSLSYKIVITSDNILEKLDDVVVPGVADEPFVRVTVSNLSPDCSYKLAVAVVLDRDAGPAVHVQCRTAGQPLPRAKIVDARVSPDSGTSIRITWRVGGQDDSEDTPKKWLFGLYYGTSEADLLQAGVRVKTQDTSLTIKNLDACVTYSFLVAVVGPGGFGPPSAPFSVSTKYSPGAAPKNLKAELDPANRSHILVTWQSSCTVVESLSYVISIRDVKLGRESSVKLARQNSTGFSHVFQSNVRFGTVYQVWVKTDDPNSLAAGPVNVTTVPIPMPEMLTYHPDVERGVHVVMWRAPEKKLQGYLKDDFIHGNVSYKIYISDHESMNHTVKQFQATGPPYTIPMDCLDEGHLYFLAVSMLDKDGYESRKSDPVAIESPVSAKSLVVSKSNLTSVLLPIGLLMLIMASALGYYMFRNHRLSRRMREFTSRYSHAAGSAFIVSSSAAAAAAADLDDDTYDDDETPIIRGFSDQEPLVNA